MSHITLKVSDIGFMSIIMWLSISIKKGVISASLPSRYVFTVCFWAKFTDEVEFTDDLICNGFLYVAPLQHPLIIPNLN